MGSIVTTKPFIRRTPYTGVSSQPLFSKVSNGASFAIFKEITSSATPSAFGREYERYDNTNYFTDLNFFSQQNAPFNVIGNASIRDEFATMSHLAYQIPGVYATNKEFLPVNTFIDQVATLITNESQFASPLPNGFPTTAQYFVGYPIEDEGLPEYDKNRHA